MNTPPKNNNQEKVWIPNPTLR